MVWKMRSLMAILWLVLSATCVPASANEIPPRVGTELEPEISDPPGDVFYDPSYVGEDREYLDILAAWFEYDSTADKLMTKFKVAAFEGVEDGPEGGFDPLVCRLTAPATVEGRVAGRFTFTFNIDADGDLNSGVHFVREGASDGPNFPHVFTVDWTRPGYASFAVERSRVQDYAENFEGVMDFSCKETRAIGVFAFENFDTAEAEATFGLAEFGPDRPASGPGGAEPWETEETEPTVNATGQTVGVTAMVALSIMLGVSLYRRRKQV